MQKITENCQKFVSRMYSIISSEQGQTAIEYALVAVLIAIVLVLAFKGVECGISSAAVKVNSALSK
jgi:Flp pilus assembly pilin Flp